MDKLSTLVIPAAGIPREFTGRLIRLALVRPRAALAIASMVGFIAGALLL